MATEEIPGHRSGEEKELSRGHLNRKGKQEGSVSSTPSEEGSGSEVRVRVRAVANEVTGQGR